MGSMGNAAAKKARRPKPVVGQINTISHDEDSYPVGFDQNLQIRKSGSASQKRPQTAKQKKNTPAVGPRPMTAKRASNFRGPISSTPSNRVKTGNKGPLGQMMANTHGMVVP
jgi:hypothetical protein